MDNVRASASACTKVTAGFGGTVIWAALKGEPRVAGTGARNSAEALRYLAEVKSRYQGLLVARSYINAERGSMR